MSSIKKKKPVPDYLQHEKMQCRFLKSINEQSVDVGNQSVKKNVICKFDILYYLQKNIAMPYLVPRL